MPADSTDSRDTRASDALLAALPDLLRELAASNVVELEVSAGDARLYVRQRPGAPPPAPALSAPAGAAESAPEEEGLIPVAAPLSGMYYAGPSPADPPYVQEGDAVEEGQVVGLVEAMKVFNEIHAETAGTVAKLLVASGALVHAKQPILLIRPA
jgi:acetyl-CoA carboxylase biotin carboxyl carrier protein